MVQPKKTNQPLLSPTTLGSLEVQNRIIRSATLEGVCDINGVPTEAYINLYRDLAKGEVGTIITGSTAISPEGDSIYPCSASIDNDATIPHFAKVTQSVHKEKSRIIMQLSHAGRQTKRSKTKKPVWGVSSKLSPYFLELPRILGTSQIETIINSFAKAALRAQKAGFDGIQLQAGHGDLIHQFLHPAINSRIDIFGINPHTQIATLFLGQVIDKVRELCGEDFPLLVKVSGSDKTKCLFSERQFLALIKFLDTKKVTAIEISYGTLDRVLNICRGTTLPSIISLDFDPVYRAANPLHRMLWRNILLPFQKEKTEPFSPCYNLPLAEKAKAITTIPIISVGGFRNYREMSDAITEQKCDFVALSRPFIAEPNFVQRLKKKKSYKSYCSNCNICLVKSGIGGLTHCYLYSKKIKM